jgi:hypothetical protein
MFLILWLEDMMKITFGKIIDSIIKKYDEAMKRDDIYKPFAWAVYQTWKWVDINETPREEK